MNAARWTCIALASVSAGCASTSPRFYTLMPESGHGPSAALATGYRLEVEPVRIPAQVDRLELVTRLPDGGIAIADGDRWIAPLADELQGALSVELLRRLAGVGTQATRGTDPVLVRVNVERFESSPNRYALIEASWNLEIKDTGKGLRIVCRTRAYEPVTGTYPAIVKGYQRALAHIADQIAATAQESAAPLACPAS